MQQSSILGFLQKPKVSRSESSRRGQPYHSRNKSDSDSRHNSNGQRRGPNRRRNMDLKAIADETKAELPNILGAIPSFDATDSSIYDLVDLCAPSSTFCPGFALPHGDVDAGKKGTKIQVFDMDTFDAALKLAPNYTVSTHLGLTQPTMAKTSTVTTPADPDSMDITAQAPPPYPKDCNPSKPVAVLNLASERSPGGGWQNGALAQEECLCYRSSLYLSLHKSHYPLPSLTAIYSPNVVLIRDAMSRGHTLLTPRTQPAVLPVTAVISVAALRRPQLTDDKKHFRNVGQRAETKRKIRVALRVAAHGGHTRLVLGALGCGVFSNPPKEVAECFLEVLRETEFQGGWWEEVAFAVLDNVKGPDGGKDGTGNYGEFYRVLHGQVV